MPKRRRLPIRYRYVRAPRGRRRARFGLGGRTLTTVIVSALASLVGLLVGSRFLPTQYAVAGGLGIGGVASYLLDGKTTGAALIGSAVGLAALPTVAGLIGGGRTSTGGQMWV